MKNLLICLVLIGGLIGCTSSYEPVESPNPDINSVDNDTIRIVSDKVEYEIIIIEPGFNSWLQGRAHPRGYYTQQWLENRNIIYVTEWNNRVLDPTRYDPNLYMWQIDYKADIDYGYEVNYLLYYYFIYFQRVYKQRLAGFIPRL